MRQSIIVASTVVAAALAGCDALKMDYVPTPAQVTASHGTFLVAPKAVTGHYANMDVDSVVFAYTSGTEPEIFWSTLDSAAESANWKCTKSIPNQRHYERLIPKTGQNIFHSTEQVRISYDSTNNAVVVAWVQADTTEAVEEFSQTGESLFAESIVWPRFNALAPPPNGITNDTSNHGDNHDDPFDGPWQVENRLLLLRNKETPIIWTGWQRPRRRHLE